jgi:tRNA pseudouridine55 synthase
VTANSNTPSPPAFIKGLTLHGWIILDKPLGMGSTQGVGAVKRALRDGGYAKVKVGHGGTLDPLATGVLPIALGEATKLAGRMLDSDKVYEFTIGFGAETDTLDLEGKVIATSGVRPTQAQIKAVLQQFTGPIAQVPPVFSALKVDGQRAYDRARRGEAVVLATRSITVHSLRVSALPHEPADLTRGRGDAEERVTLTAHVSKGTYIRSLARDIARALGTVGHVAMLRRTKAGPFTLKNAISLDFLFEKSNAQRLEDICLPLTAGLDDILALPVTPDQAGLLRQGQVLIGIAANDGLKLAKDGDTPVALVEAIAGEIRVVRGFNL